MTQRSMGPGGVNEQGTEPQRSEPEEFSVPSVLETIKNAIDPKLAGWAELDALGVQFHPKELVLICARTGHGKTTAVMNLLMNWLEAYEDQTFLFYSYEIPLDAIFLKLVAALVRKTSGVTWSYYKIREYFRGRTDGHDEREIEAVQNAVATIEKWQDRLIAVYQPEINVQEMAEHARRQKEIRGSIGAVLVDYLQLVPPTGSHERRDLEVTAVARAFKRLAVELSSPVVSATQLSREAVVGTSIPQGRPFDAIPVQEAIRQRRPQLHHIQEGGSEQEADLVLGLLNYRADFIADREDAGLAGRDQASPLDVMILKNRYGELGVATLIFEGASGLIRSMSFRTAAESKVFG